MTTDKMLIEIVSYKYESAGFPYVFLDYNQFFDYWSITWRNPVKFSNEEKRHGKTPNEACQKALEFIKSNPNIFKRYNKPEAEKV
jgi:hypothetical protein